MKMRTSDARDEQSPLIAHGGVDGGGDRPTTFAAIGRRTKMVLGATAVVLCGGAALASSADARARIGDWIPKNGVLLAPVPTNMAPTVTFDLHTQCLPGDLKESLADFMLSGAPIGHVVRHNYGSDSFFEESDAIQMERVVLPSEERIWRVTTNGDVNFEYGFALKNAETGEWKYEIGKDASSPLANAEANCAQKYGEYFNRVLTREDNPNSVSYVYGTCDTECPSNMVESTWDDKMLLEDVPELPNMAVLGEGNDARLVNIRSGITIKYGDIRGPPGRGMAARDKQFAETREKARHIVAVVDPYPTSDVKLVHVEVILEGTTLKVYKIGQKLLPLGHNCFGTECAIASHDISADWHNPKATTNVGYNMGAYALQYTIGVRGDTKPKQMSHTFPNSAFLTTWKMYDAGTWGMDLDVRRVVFQSGGMCGKDWFEGRCIRMLAPERYTSFTATAQEAQWVFVIAGGGNSEMIRVRVYQQNGAVMVQAAEAKRTGQCPNPPMHYYKTQFHREFDVLQCSISIKDRWAAGSAKPIAATSTSSGFGIGSVQWMLAAEMSASLARAWKL